MSDLTLRDMRHGEAPVLADVFYRAVRETASAHYSPAQVEAWAPEQRDMTEWETRMARTQPFVAEIEGRIVGFSDLQADGLIDFLFVHPDAGGQGVGSALLGEALRRGRAGALSMLYSYVSQTAKPLFLRHGFEVVNAQTVEVRGVTMTNSHMERHMNDRA